MIPNAFMTIPEARVTMEGGVDYTGQRVPPQFLEAAILDGHIHVFSDHHCLRIPLEDLQELGNAWAEWFWSGRVPKANTPDPFSEEYDAFDWDQAVVRYRGHRLLLRQDDFRNWLQPWLHEFNDEPTTPRSGAPGRPLA